MTNPFTQATYLELEVENPYSSYQPTKEKKKEATVKFSRLGSPKRYKSACKVLHKLSKSKSLSPAQNYLILTMPLGRSFVFLSLMCLHPDAYLLHIHSRHSGPMPYLHRIHSRHSIPTPHTFLSFWSCLDASRSHSDAPWSCLDAPWFS